MSVEVKKFYTLDSVVKCSTNVINPFIFANETLKKDRTVGRSYVIMDSFSDFEKVRGSYPHSHELMINHVNNNEKVDGRLVFDFDIDDKSTVPDCFNKQVESVIEAVVDKYYINVDKERIEFVWSVSENPNKFSKHLTVKGFHFSNWIVMSKIFYDFFRKIWDKMYRWIGSDKIIDYQIVRKNATLRMVGSSKISNGYKLVFENDDHILADGMIRVYDENEKQNEQMIGNDNLKSSFDTHKNISEPSFGFSGKIEYQKSFKPPKYSGQDENPNDIGNDAYLKAHKMARRYTNDKFKLNKINGKFMIYKRLVPSKCIVCKRTHENSDAYVVINRGFKGHYVSYGCYRNGRVKLLGLIEINTVPDSEPVPKPKKKVIPKKRNVTSGSKKSRVRFTMPIDDEPDIKVKFTMPQDDDLDIKVKFTMPIDDEPDDSVKFTMPE